MRTVRALSKQLGLIVLIDIVNAATVDGF